MQIGFIGLGRMGKPMAQGLLKANYPLTVYDRNQSAVAELAGEGAIAASSLTHLAQSCDSIITILPADEQILEVYTKEDGLLTAVRDGCVCVDMTTARGDTLLYLQSLAAKMGKEISFVDAPVSGGVPAAEKGALTILTGGEKEVIDRVMPLFEVMGSAIFYTGALGSAKSVKGINQLLNAANTLAACEAMFLAQKWGVDRELLCDIIAKSSGDSWVLRNNIPKFVIPGQFEGGFRLDLMCKDVNLILDKAADDRISLPALQKVREIYNSVLSQGMGEQNYSVVSKYVQAENSRIGSVSS